MANGLKNVFKSQAFTLALIGAVIAAVVAPWIGVAEGPLRTEATSKIAVALTFLVQGLSLPTRQILRSATKFKVHSFNLLCNFCFAPLLMIAFLAVVGKWIHPGLEAGFLYLSILPTTISSAIVMTSSSEGDSSTALFSTTLANVLGVFITPVLCAELILYTSDGAPSLGTTIGKIALLVLTPLIVGQLIRPWIREWANKSKASFKRVSNSLVVFIVYAAFCQSVESGIWGEVGAATIVAVLLIAIAFLLLFSALVWLTSPMASNRIDERIAIFFCGSHKTLAAGVPMASILFSSLPAESDLTLGLIILPLMCFHPLQLFLAGFLTPLFAGQAR
ncbi:bile acid:sodium symporter family protein [Pelagicoccus mobilis]|uniref:Bile acid:sodium symporter n=1 Tax=Pelagicoccus mobilis TaxID=415221 RepID=A0A934RS36_9BACT|nr:bile acid:sodium symporter family protein [Pelagicoccus mobilis]MBK1875852.1 bile acid:sodium symporter [Pelagicoccus mobilis]